MLIWDWDKFNAQQYPPVPPPFVPMYERVVYRETTPGKEKDLPLNLPLWPDEASTLWLMHHYGASRWAFDGSNEVGPDGSDVYQDTGLPAIPRRLFFAAGTPIKNNAGMTLHTATKPFSVAAGSLSAAYARNPEADHPPQWVTIGSGINAITVMWRSIAEQQCWLELLSQALAAEAA